LRDVIGRVGSKNIFLRNDFNVPIKKGVIKDSQRIDGSLSTIRDILERNPRRLIMASHLGRPDGVKNPEFSLRPVRDYLEQKLNRKVEFVEDFVSEQGVRDLQNAEGLFLLENLRFHGEEEGKIEANGEKIKVDKKLVGEFRKKLTSFADLFVNDAFGTMHRAHSSIVGINTPLRVAGNLVEKELTFFGKALEGKYDKFVLVLGGAKVSDKIPVIQNILGLASDVVIGGGMAFTFLKALQNCEVANSLLDETQLDTVRNIKKLAEEKKVRIHLPVDVVGQNDQKIVKHFVLAQGGIESGFRGLDIGPQTVQNFSKVLEGSNMVIMNGPMGLFEQTEFAQGSFEIARKLAELCDKGTIGIVGGGDTATMVVQAGVGERLSHISTGGGATLELLSGLQMPGITFLSDKSELK
jgi:phosphoglycerate kinase